MRIPELVQFSIYRGETKYAGLMKAIKDFFNGYVAYTDTNRQISDLRRAINTGASSPNV